MAFLADAILAVTVTGSLAAAAWWRWDALDDRGREYLAGLSLVAWPLGFAGGTILVHDVLRATGPVLLPGMLLAVALAAAVLATLVGLGALLPPRRAAWVLAAPIVVLVGIAVLPVWSTIAGIGAGLFLGPAAMALGAFGSQGLAAVLPADAPRRIQRVGKAVGTGALVVAASLAGFFTLVPFGVGSTATSHLAWSATLQPDEPGSYTVEIPFFVLEQGTPYRDQVERALGFLQDNVRVREDDATFRWTGDRSAIVVEGDGPATVAADVSYYTGGGTIEAHSYFTLRNRTVDRRPGGPGNVTVTVEVALDGGYCFSEGTGIAEVPPGGADRLDGTDEGRDDEARFWSTACI